MVKSKPNLRYLSDLQKCTTKSPPTQNIGGKSRTFYLYNFGHATPNENR